MPGQQGGQFGGLFLLDDLVSSLHGGSSSQVFANPILNESAGVNRHPLLNFQLRMGHSQVPSSSGKSIRQIPSTGTIRKPKEFMIENPDNILYFISIYTPPH